MAENRCQQQCPGTCSEQCTGRCNFMPRTDVRTDRTNKPLSPPTSRDHSLTERARETTRVSSWQPPENPRDALNEGLCPYCGTDLEPRPARPPHRSRGHCRRCRTDHEWSPVYEPETERSA